MSTLLLLIIYITFISLGLPDSMLGSAWPIISKELGLELSNVGIISMVVSVGTIISSISSGYLIKKLGTTKLVIISVFLTATALLGFSFSKSIVFFIILAIPLGLGAGAIDSALNHYVSINYSARHMNWLHSFWGVGATLSPLIMSFMISKTSNWRNGYLTVGIIQSVLVLILISTSFLWKNAKKVVEDEKEEKNADPLNKINGSKTAMLSFLFYCALEMMPGLWGASYLVSIKGFTPANAAALVSSFFFGIMIGRIISGFITTKIGNKNLIRIGQIIISIGILLLLFINHQGIIVVSFALIGLGCAPIFPAFIHETPKRFGKNNAPKLISLQIASAYVGTTLTPFITSFLVKNIGLKIFPYLLVIFFIGLIINSEITNIKTNKSNEN